MAQLLVSVKNVEEAKQVLLAGVDFIDLKDPTTGALGDLGETLTQTILTTIKTHASFDAAQTRISATIGDDHPTEALLLARVMQKAGQGVDIVKLSISKHLQKTNVIASLREIQAQYGTQLIAIFDANKEIDLSWVAHLKNTGFYGAMLDTSNKQQSLLDYLSERTISEFVQICHQQHLFVGLAGSLRLSQLNKLKRYQANFLGFRSGVCQSGVRTAKMSPDLVKQLKNALHTCNNFV